MLTFYSYSFQYFSSINTFILKKYIAWKSILAPRSMEISTGPASTQYWEHHTAIDKKKYYST